MTSNKFPNQLKLVTIGCVLPIIFEVSAPAMAFDFQLNGGLSVPSSAVTPSFSSFSGIFSIPEPVSTYTGYIPSSDISLYNDQGKLVLEYFHPQSLPAFERPGGFEGSVGDGGRKLEFGDRFSGLDLTFSSSDSPAGLRFSSGSFNVIGITGPATSAAITPVPEPSNIGDILFLPGLAFCFLRIKR